MGSLKPDACRNIKDKRAIRHDAVDGDPLQRLDEIRLQIAGHALIGLVRRLTAAIAHLEDTPSHREGAYIVVLRGLAGVGRIVGPG